MSPNPKLVQNPKLRGLALRYLLAHARKPDLVADSKNSSLRRLAGKEEFYDGFVQRVMAKTRDRPEGMINEQWLLAGNAWRTQKDFKTVLETFKEVSGVRNPFAFSEIGRVIPAVGDPLTLLLSTVAGPSVVINSSAGYNKNLNNDQRIVIEGGKAITVEGKVHATVQHYLLPSVETPYLEMVTAALGYWEGVPLLWGVQKFGETELLDIQLTPEFILGNDLKYLGATTERRGDILLINGKTAGKILTLDKILQERAEQELFDPKFTQLTWDQLLPMPLPVHIEESFALTGEESLPPGFYGMPGFRYKVILPDVGLKDRAASIGNAALNLVGLGEENPYAFLKKESRKAVMRDAINEALVEAERADRERAEAAEAQIDAANARAEAAEQRERAARSERLQRLSRTRGRHRKHDLVNLTRGVAVGEVTAATELAAFRLHDLYTRRDEDEVFGRYLAGLEARFNTIAGTAMFDLTSDGLTSGDFADSVQSVFLYAGRTLSEVLEVNYGLLHELVGRDVKDIDEDGLDELRDENQDIINVFGSVASYLESQQVLEKVDALVKGIEEDHDALVETFSLEEAIGSALEEAITYKAHSSLKGRELELDVQLEESYGLVSDRRSTQGVFKDLAYNSIDFGATQISIRVGNVASLDGALQERVSELFEGEEYNPHLFIHFEDDGLGLGGGDLGAARQKANEMSDYLNDPARIKESHSTRGSGMGLDDLKIFMGLHDAKACYVAHEDKPGTSLYVFISSQEMK